MDEKEKSKLLEALVIEASEIMDNPEWSIVLKSKSENGNEYEREIGNL